MEMLLTGELVGADEAQLARPRQPRGGARPTWCNEAIDARAARSRQSRLRTLKIGKEAFYRQLEMPLAEAYDYAAEVMTENMLARRSRRRHRRLPRQARAALAGDHSSRRIWPA